MSNAKTVNLCSSCGEVRYCPPDFRGFCIVKGTEVPDDKSWSEGMDPHDVCESYRGPLGFDWDEWERKFKDALVRETRRALDEGSLRPSEIIRALA